MDENRQKALDAALGQIERQFGKGSVMRLGDAQAGQSIESISTGSLGLDIALGIGGCRVAASSRFMVPNRQARQPLRFP